MTWTVTGSGAAASVGVGTDELFANLCAGKTGRAPLRGFDRANFRAQNAYEIDDRLEAGADRPGRATEWLSEAIRQAADEAGLGEDLSEIPILVGTGLRELRSMELWWQELAAFDLDRLHFGRSLRERFGTTTSYTFSNACSASLYALAMGTDLLSLDVAETVIVAGVDVLTESMHGLLERVHPTPPDRVRPFDRNRTGVLMGDGAAAVVLRKDTTATGGEPGLGRVRSVSVNCDAFHVTAPHPEGIASAMNASHRAAGIKPADVDLVLLHGTGTLLNDEVEAQAMNTVYGEHIDRPRMTAIKSMTGHTSGASGLMNLVVGLRCLATSKVPPTVGLDDPVDEVSRFRFARGSAAHERMSVAQINAFGFGGINAVAILEVNP
jgi:3-oxoacyl-[acyl-carrier-protein] synthase II